MRLIKSIEAKTVKASVILDKINSYARDNSVAKGLKELGRLLKTMYLLDFFTDSNLKKEVQQMLNKGESINSVSRLTHFGKSGRKLKKEKIEAHFYGKLINILVNNEVSKILNDEIDGETLILSDKKVFNQVSYCLKRLHHYSYRIFYIFEKLKILIPKTCLKSKRKDSISSDEILKLVT